MTTSTDSTENGYVPASVVASIMNVSTQDLMRLVRANQIPPPLGDSHHLLRTVQAYIVYLQTQASDPTKAVKADLAREQLRSKRLANDRQERLTLPVEEVSMLLVGALDVVRQGLLEQPSRLAEMFPGLSHDVFSAIDAANRSLLASLAETPLPEPLPPDLERLDAAAGSRPARMDA